MILKAITIHQPWATLIALGEKWHETRGWATKYRGELAIHAGKYIDREACMNPRIASVLWKHGYSTPDDLPTGVIVAIANLTDCLKAGVTSGENVILESDKQTKFINRNSNEYAFGYYGNGRYAWQLDGVERLANPVPAKGQQGLWNWGTLNAEEGNKVTFRDTFAPTGSDYMRYKGMRFAVIRELEPGKEYDREDDNHRMYEIELENGKRIHAFHHEVEIFPD